MTNPRLFQAEARDSGRVLLTGASGYVGGKLLKALADKGVAVRCMARNPDSLEGKVPAGSEIAAADVLKPASLQPALRGVTTAYYLIHSMATAGDFEEEDRRGALQFGEAALEAGVEKIIYLGGLGDSSRELSPHLRSRQEVGEILRASGVSTIEFRASIVIGSGSLSFELVRSLTERLPVMIAPRWVSTPAQPIAIEDLIAYLVAGLDYPGGESRVFEIGGSERASYGEIMLEYARRRSLRRLIIPVPVLTPRLSSLWLGLITPVYARVGRRLIESLRHPSVMEDQSAAEVFGITPRPLGESIELALVNEDREYSERTWSSDTSTVQHSKTWGGHFLGGRIVDRRAVEVDHSPEEAFEPIRRLGGRTGWYYANWLWKLRGWIDRLLGGVGMGRGRRHPVDLRAGDTLDFWRVEKVEVPGLLRLAAEMKLPGRAWLVFEVEGNEHRSTIWQTAVFDPHGLAGLAYWYLLYPFHRLVFAGMLAGIAGSVARKDPEISKKAS